MMHFRVLTLLLMMWLVMISAFFDSVPAQTLEPAQIVDLYSQAKDLFRQADELAAKSPETAEDLYAKSAMRYEQIIREGKLQNGKLYYNLGNIYFRMKDMGRAILNYRRAEQYMPNDPNLKQNLGYARQKRLDKLDEKQETKVLKTLFFWHYDLSGQHRFFLFVLCFTLLWIFAGIRLFTNRSVINWGIGIFLILSVSFASSLTADEIILRTRKPGVILSPEVIARKGNSETYAISFKEPLHSGTEFILIENRDNWYQVELADARTCWLPSKDVALVR